MIGTAVWYLPMPWMLAAGIMAIAKCKPPGLAATAWWFGPMVLVQRTMPEWSFVPVVLWTLHLTTTLVREPRGGEGALAGVCALSLQGFVLLLGAGYGTLAAAIIIVPTVILTSAFAPLRIPWRRTLSTLALLLLALIPMGGFLESPMGSAGKGARLGDTEPTEGRSGTDKTKGEIHRGVILWPPEKKSAKPVPPRPMRVNPSQLAPQAVSRRIPFEGVYWFFQRPLSEPPPLSLTDYGVPTAKSYRSTGGRTMVMEAHQHFVTRMPIAGIRWIDVEITNGDPMARNTRLELVLRDTSQRGGVPWSLGVVPVISRPESDSGRGGAKPAPDVLRFRVPANGPLSAFDAATIRYHRFPFASERSTRLDIRAFVLVP